MVAQRPQYGRRYQRLREQFRGSPCMVMLVCDGAPSTSADHDPPLSRHVHVEGSGCCVLRPSCWPCQQRQRVLLAGQTRHFRKYGIPIPMAAPNVQPEHSQAWL